ncbi:DUF1707 domain-containing protein [Nocardia sp. 2]|uniref:DUF1707 domain-containing protein n=1 Tax=Nocardia acididurans TaxID=2802282 RepID=A0ABS1LYD6_9NOCA|nr:DUF1707 domain-containing protein [Nocardia acididurans]MBL1072925.1 DUF1707 domain-containing protein [Nocardia acididurans]
MVSKSPGSAGLSGAAGQMRARDIDRVNTRARLDAAYEEGQLGNEEYHSRSERAAKAETLGQLHRLVADLQESAGTADLALPQPDSGKGRAARGAYPGEVRARDKDRSAACALLDAARGDGQLSQDDHRALTELAGAAKTLGELADLTADLQRPADAPAAPRPPRARRKNWFTAVVAVAATAAAIGAFVAVDSTGSTSEVRPAADLGVIEPRVVPMPNLLSEEGISYFRDLYRTKFGDGLVDELSFHDGYASLRRPVSGQPNRQEDYSFRGGFERSGAPVTRKTDTPVFDLATLEVAALGRLITGAPATVKVPDGVVTHLVFDIEGMARARSGDKTVIVRIYVSNAAEERGYIEMSATGDVVRVSEFKG